LLFLKKKFAISSVHKIHAANKQKTFQFQRLYFMWFFCRVLGGPLSNVVTQVALALRTIKGIMQPAQGMRNLQGIEKFLACSLL